MNAEIVPTYGTGDAAHAAGLEQRQADAWLSRGTFRLESNDTPAGGHGKPRGWSLRTVRKLALMTSLHRAGVNPARASTWSELCLKRCDHLAPDVRHYAAFQNDGGVKILSVERSSRFEDALDDLINGSDSVVIVDLTRLFSRVDERLAAVTTFTG